MRADLRTGSIRRKLGAEHFAFMRALVQGVSERDAWDRYLGHEGEAKDARLVRSTIAWIRDEFAAAARRESRFGTARLVQADVNPSAAKPDAVPSLEEFARDAGMEDYAYAEQLLAFEEIYGRTSRRLQRRGRLVARQLEALRWLEGLVAQPPKPGDDLAVWLHPRLAAHLAGARIGTLAELFEHINGIGRRWYVSVPAVGQGKAERVLGWIRNHEVMLRQVGLTLGAHVGERRRTLRDAQLKEVVAPAADIRPLEKFIVPAALDGRAGANRARPSSCSLPVNSDREALWLWLTSKSDPTRRPEPLQHAEGAQGTVGEGRGVVPLAANVELPSKLALSNTQRAYRKEAERLLLWTVLVRHKALSSLDPDDCAAYLDFLADPQPRARWCGKRARERWSPLWRPFEGPLSAVSRRHAATILKSLFGFLTKHGYLVRNPWRTLALPQAAPGTTAWSALTSDQWAFLLQQLKARKPTSANHRLFVALLLLRGTGLSLSALTRATLEQLRAPTPACDGEPAGVGEGWALSVPGQGGRSSRVPVPADTIEALRSYLAVRRLQPDPDHLANQGAYLLGKATDIEVLAPGLARVLPGALDPFVEIAASTLYKQIRAFAADCAAEMVRLGDKRGAESLRLASGCRQGWQP